jgi:spore coat protein A
VQYIGPVVAPAANEMGWKDTVEVHPGTVTRIITKFEGYQGRYVWHCHILEHEDNEMMRPYEVTAK